MLKPFRIILLMLLCYVQPLFAQKSVAPCKLKLLGTRSWIRVQWEHCERAQQGYNIFWSTKNIKPSKPQAVVAANTTRHYIQDLQPEQKYFVWVESKKAHTKNNISYGEVVTTRQWTLDPDEANQLDIPSSAAVPEGMKLFWHDEFNDELLNRNKWSTNYYSNIDYLYKINFSKMKADSLPQPAYILNGKTINLFTNDTLPAEVYDIKNNKKISSIQTYDWGKNESLLDNGRGGYFEVRVKRSSTGKPRGLNTAFWFDSPGPDLKYYLEDGTVLDGVKGIRPKGQVFEIDVFEYLNAQFVLHGHVDTNGRFQRNLATHIAEGYKHIDNWVVHGMLWTPTSIKHYINGNLIKEYADKNKIYAPDHFMNVLLGSYGGGGTVNMEADYIRGYQWPLEGNNELPNGGAEYSSHILPWEGTAVVSPAARKLGNSGFELEPGQALYQYVYLDHAQDYRLTYWVKGAGSIEAAINNITPVSGAFEDNTLQTAEVSSLFTAQDLSFKTGKAHENNMKTVRISFTNTGKGTVFLDDITVVKNNKGK
ncbi:MAG: fibronectin type III domain-containing protein [Chitinophagaceae bacterium]|nr:fibronectin type III domain-containing protein [Chitinophagaceae bacterium]